MGDFLRLLGRRHSDSLAKQVESFRPSVCASVLSCVRCGLLVVGNWTPAQPRIIPQASELTVEPPSHVGYQGLRRTLSAWRSWVPVWIRAKN